MQANKMIRRVVVKQKLLGYLQQPTLYSQYFDREKSVFIHVPKAAGTSIAKAIYGDDPWHYSAQECRFLNRKKFDQYYSFAISRHPVSRIVSSFNYAKTHVIPFSLNL